MRQNVNIPLPIGTRVRVIADIKGPPVPGGVVVESRANGCLVRHDDGPTYGWNYAEVEREPAGGERG